jgi:lipopolysaccharide transport system ATP-binding protein
MSNIIQVENLSKKYIIGHQQLKGKKTLRDAIYQSIASFGSKFVNPFSKNISSNSPFEEFWALKDINFEVEQGERIGIIGRNGAGKSTLLKVLSRITEPTTGKITIKGRVASLLEVGTGFNGELTGRENIFLNGAILGMHRAEIKQKFEEIVDFSGIEKFLDTPVKRYSSGMYVRLAFAVAAHLEPEILIVDEVLAVGDAEFQDKCLGKMKELSSKNGRTLIFVSHNMAAIKVICEKSILLDKGQLVSYGKTDDVINLYTKKGLLVHTHSKEIRDTDRIKTNDLTRIVKIELYKIVPDILSSSFFIFEPFKIRLFIEERVKVSNRYSYWLVIKNKEGDAILSSFEYDNEFTYNDLELPNFIVDILIDPNVLLPGIYLISVGIFANKIEIIEWVENVISFEVESSFLDGRNFDHRLGKISLKYNWNKL